MDDAWLPQSQSPTSRGQLQLCNRTPGDFAGLNAGTYWIDGASIIHVARQDSEGKNHDFSVPISVENAEYPTQICFVETTDGIACTA